MMHNHLKDRKRQERLRRAGQVYRDWAIATDAQASQDDLREHEDGSQWSIELGATPGDQAVLRAKTMAALGQGPFEAKHLPGQHNQMSHGNWARRLDPTFIGGPLTLRGKPQPPNPRATHFENLPADHRAKMYEKLGDWEFASDAPDAMTYPAIVRNVQSLWDEAPSEVITEGAQWYQRAHEAGDRMASEHGFESEQAYAAIAALSPQQSWHTNVSYANWVMDKVRTDEKFTLPEKYVDRLLNPVPDPRGNYTPNAIDVRPMLGRRLSDMDPSEAATALAVMLKREDVVADYPGHEMMVGDGSRHVGVAGVAGRSPIVKAIQILRDPDAVDDALSGHKVRSFYNNILDPHDDAGHGDVTIDTHAVMAALRILHPTTRDPELRTHNKRVKEAAARLLAGAPSSKALGMTGLYAVFASAYRDVAEKAGVPPNHVQAAIWTYWRILKGLDDE